MKRIIAVTTGFVLLLGTAHASAFANGKDHLWRPPTDGPPVDTQVEGWGENSSQSLPFSFSPFDTRNSESNREMARNSFNTVLANCTSSSDIGCIESIRYSADGQSWNDAVFTRTLQQRDFAYGTPTGDPDNPWDMQRTSTWDANPSLGLLKASLPNEYELAEVPHGMGDDYTINVTATSTVVDGIAKIQGLKFEAIAGGVNDQSGYECDYWGISNEIIEDDPVAYCYEAVDLPENLQLEVNVQLGNRINELTGWFDGRIFNPTIVFGTSDSPGLITVKGSPMKVNYFETSPIPKGHELFDVPDFINDMQKANGIGTRGMWRPRTGLDTFLRLESFVPEASAEIDTIWKIESWARDVMIDECASNAGVQGIIITNATTYSPNPPSFNSESANLEFQVASSHFLPDGTTLNSGYYKLIIQESLADCLWGAGNAATASISVTDDKGGENESVNRFELIDGWVSFTASNFHFSAPKIYVGLNKSTDTPEKSTASSKPQSNETTSVVASPTPVPTIIPSPSPEQSAIAIPQEEPSNRIPANVLFGIALGSIFAIGAVSMFVRKRI